MLPRRVCVFAIMIVVIAATQGETQVYPYRGVAMPRPIISPYLNLFRAGNTADFNYLTLVQPEIQIRKNIGQLQQFQANQQSAQASTYNEGELTTGHAFGFGTQKKYFNTLGSGGGQSFRSAGPTPNLTGQTRTPGTAASTSGSTKRTK